MTDLRKKLSTVTLKARNQGMSTMIFGQLLHKFYGTTYNNVAVDNLDDKKNIWIDLEERLCKSAHTR